MRNVDGLPKHNAKFIVSSVAVRVIIAWGARNRSGHSLTLRIFRSVERLDCALANLHLVLPTIEICFYDVGADSRRLAAKPLRKVIQRWDAASRITRRG